MHANYSEVGYHHIFKRSCRICGARNLWAYLSDALFHVRIALGLDRGGIRW